MFRKDILCKERERRQRKKYMYLDTYIYLNYAIIKTCYANYVLDIFG